MSMRLKRLISATLALAAPAFFQAAAANPVEDFYRGKNLEMVVPTSPGGDYDIRGRLVARNLGRFIPGNPNIVARNMPGGLGVAAANYLARVAPRDGTVLHAIFQNMPVLQAIGAQGVEFDVRRFGWIGNTTNSPNVINSWHTTGIKTIQDVMTRELVVGAPGAASTSYIYPAALNALVGTKFKIVAGYPGGNDVNLAMEKGEVGGRGSNSWASWKSGHPHWLAEKKVTILVQIGLQRAPDLPDVPLMHELAKTEEDRQVLTFLSADMGIARAFATTPGAPPERVAALRKAFADMLRDPAFIEETTKIQMEISPSTGEEAQRVAASMLDMPANVIAKAKRLIVGPSK
jgi:tripartite-type tricarboxylate transporter receptor subunit TctC